LEMIIGILTLVGRVMMETITSPFFLSVYLLLFTLVCWQYKRMESISEKLTGSGEGNFLRSALQSSLVGILGGLLGSLLLIILGINLDSIGFVYLWILALLLMLINQRFLCFAYAAGLLSLSSLLFSFPAISIPHLLALVAVLHMVESFLILLNGHNYPIPLYVKKQGKIIGGLNLQKFWPLPLLALVGVSGLNPGEGLAMPGWWPLMSEYSGITDQTYTLLPVLAILGYGEITTTSPPALRVRKSSLNLFIYSLVLLLLASISCRLTYLAIVAALFAPLGHELVIWLGMREESNRRPLYVRSGEGIAVLKVRAGSPAARAGIRESDIITRVNGFKVDHYAAAREILSGFSRPHLEIKRAGQVIMVRLATAADDDPGIIPVPEEPVARYMPIDEDRIFKLARRLWHRFGKIPRSHSS